MADATDLSPQDPEPASPTPTPPAEQADPLQPFTRWLRRVLICNPFYLVSAALLLYGFYRVSSDTGFLRGEIAQLAFNLSSLQAYELLLAATAVFLARRCLWYDSTLLVCLENLLVLVPFILITQAALIELRLVWVLSLAAALLAAGRFASLRRFIVPLNFPRRLVPVGLVLLAANVALPIVYRILEQSKIGARPDFGAAYNTNLCAWLLLLPVLCALANFLPSSRNTGELLPQRGWLPAGWFSLWLAGTVVHLCCLGYIYEFDLTPKMTAPALWVLLWTLQRRLSPWLERQSSAWQETFLAAPIVATFFGWSEPRNDVLLALSLLNACLYGALWIRGARRATILPLLLFSICALVAGFPEQWGVRFLAEFNRGAAVAAAMGGYLVLWAAFSRSPKAALGGALVLALFLMSLLSSRADAVHWAVQAAMVFVLLHSLRWEDTQHVGASTLRILAAAVWVADAGLWMHTGGSSWAICGLATPVLGLSLVLGVLRRSWAPLRVPIAAVLVMLTGPGNVTADRIHSLPVGLLAVLGSFLLFGLGTWVALSRRKWLT